ncbi:hypothetical protein L593_05185 [Salinarchaeum sp. Harcht-Bsk1]|uniref:DUF5789 family protein n=1 Tax=Salinarchaeum sp. Harcht-Bsk1 TaxID=1333523 RepID=UPI00034238C8|nr:DUF5789 family protein [Salinarchaeum sp. Harcht-Bsk1]AGN00986.1 hypothetical protein L593_05185 [Salinarchaeum sp. Harcht-Bsk1]
MSEDDAEDEEAEEPAVELGEQTPVEGAPLARVTARLHFPLQKSEIQRREGGSTIRTPSGPRTVTDVLADVETTYFATDDEFRSTVEDVIGTGPVPTE